MGMMIIRHKVRDYGQWRPMFDEHVAKQKEGGSQQPPRLPLRGQQ
jgi:hypothetical protein